MAERTPRSIQDPESIRAALREFDEVGREAFLSKYGVGSARKFEVVEDGRAYDAKAVLAAAFAYEFPGDSPLATTEFDGNEATVRGNLERLGYQVSVLGTGGEGLRAGLEAFRESAPGRLWLRVRRQRAAALRELLAEPGSVTLDMFNREVWPLESASVLRGEPVKLVAGGGELRWESAEAADLLEALDSGELELHGNYMWGSGTHVYGAMLQADDAEKTRNLQLAAEILNRSDIGPDQKASELEQIDGFGPNVSTGLVMAFHPTEFAIYNQPSQAIVMDMGYPTDTVAQFERSVDTLREQVGAEDFLELDLFLYVRYLRAKRSVDGSEKRRSINEIESRDSVLEAVAEFDQLGQAAFLDKYGFAKADRYFLEIDSRRYDSKAIVGAAYGYEFPERGPLRFNEFSGGAGTVQPLLERLGFTVVVEDAMSERGYWWVNQGGSYRRARDEGIISAPVSGKDGGRPPTHWSNMARLREGDVVLHYKQKSLRAVGRVVERARETDRPLPGSSDRTEHVWQARVEYFELDTPVALEDIPIDWRLAESKPFMRAGGRTGEVNQGYLYPVSAEFVERLGSRFPSIADRLKDAPALRRLPLEGGRPMPVEGEVIPLRASYKEPSFDEIVTAVAATGLLIDRAVLRRYHLSLKTRGFVILSGLSGSGKTWLTSAYAAAVGAAYDLAPVAPNWTTNEDLLGYLNPLDRQYMDTSFSLFLRDAAKETEQARRAGLTPRPFHLVLDEMNLARVEYYFAKFLSAMERRARGEPATIELGQEDVVVPPNLMFIGTVNIDETTHQFADKVYDRAQLIELGIDQGQVTAHLGDAPYATAVLDVWLAVKDIAPFAYRTLDEIEAYIRQADQLGVPWETALDEQLVQKVLPKLKGANLRIGEVLDQFILVAEPFPLSRTKAIRMRDDFARDGFTSFF